MAKMNAKKLHPDAIRKEELTHREVEGTGRGRGPIRIVQDGGDAFFLLESTFFDDDDDDDSDDEVDVEPVIADFDVDDDDDGEEPVFDGGFFAPLPPPQLDVSVGSPAGDGGETGGDVDVAMSDADDVMDHEPVLSPPTPRSTGDSLSEATKDGDGVGTGAELMSVEEKGALSHLRPYYQPTRPAGAQVAPLAKDNDGSFNTMMSLFSISNYCVSFERLKIPCFTATTFDNLDD
jgi:hypothetical protein